MISEIAARLSDAFRRFDLEAPTQVVITRETGLAMMMDPEIQGLLGMVEPRIIENANGSIFRSFKVRDIEFLYPANQLATKRGWRFE